jgi:exopolysaccharide biosynthesis polyprenyl glycosylphosphotransferase
MGKRRKMREKKQKKYNADTKSFVAFLESVLEIMVLSILYYFFWRFGYEQEPFPPYLGNGKYLLMAIYAVLCWFFMNSSEGFQFGNLRKLYLAIAQWIGLTIVNVITYFQLCLIANRMISPWPMLFLLAADLVVSTVFVFIYSSLYYRLYAPHDMVMVYGSDNAVNMKIKLDTRKERYNVSRLISADAGFDRICEEIDKAESVIVNDIPAQLRNDILKYCYEHQIRMYMVPKITDVLVRGAHNISVVDTPMLLIKGTGLTIGQRFVKRTMDILLSLLALIIASPIMLVVAVAIKIEDGGPVFYKQKRMTRDKKAFDILKFRSMIVDAEKEGKSIPATGGDPRITRVGNVIRRFRIDELPQLWNILNGDMSIVGPRPERVEHIEEFCKTMPEFSYRMKVKGGLTGYAQVYGKYNTSAYDKLRFDLMYIENYSLLLDIKLILLTMRVLFSKNSTEGFDEAEKAEKKKDELLLELHEKEIQQQEDKP